MNTEHASGKRSGKQEINSQFEKIDSISYLKDFINSLPYSVMVLNDNRQIIFSNKDFVEQLNEKDLNLVLGKRTGEAVSCIHANDCEGGCGTSRNCKHCGAVNTILKSQQQNTRVESECRIIAGNPQNPDYLNYRVVASPFRYNGDQFTIFSMMDISSEKRKKNLERIFYHDILNTAGNLQGLTDLLIQQKNEGNSNDIIRLINNLSRELVEEINAQRQITLAENGELTLKLELINSLEIIDQVIRPFTGSSAKDVNIYVDEDSDDASFYSDRMIIKRILKNMIKNAIEACGDGDRIETGVKETDDHLRFFVKNPAVIPQEIKMQIFQRSFSTKGEGRGLGTYSMKLLGERYLGARVSFISEEGKGTWFYFDIPKN